MSLSTFDVMVRRRVLQAVSVLPTEEELAKSADYLKDTGGYVWDVTLACGHTQREMPRPMTFYANRTDAFCQACSQIALDHLNSVAPDKEGMSR